jgi:hypothetical protein
LAFRIAGYDILEKFQTCLNEKFMKNFLGGFLLVLLAGCASTKVNYQPETINISEPPIGVVIEKRVGDEMVRQGRFREHEVLLVNTIVKPHWAYTVHPGYFLKIGEDDSSVYYRVGAGDEAGFIEKSALADPYKGLMLKKSSNTLCIVTILDLAGCGGDVTAGFEKSKRPTLSQNYNQQTLIYSGKVGTKINIGYREISGNMAVFSSSNSVEYDLSESNRIGYKGAVIEVLEATNQTIKYRVLSNFNSAVR